MWKQLFWAPSTTPSPVSRMTNPCIAHLNVCTNAVIMLCRHRQCTTAFCSKCFCLLHVFNIVVPLHRIDDRNVYLLWKRVFSVCTPCTAVQHKLCTEAPLWSHASDSGSHRDVCHVHSEGMIAWVQVLTEIAGETLEQMAAAPKSKAAPTRVAAATREEEEAADAEADDLQARLNAIRSWQFSAADTYLSCFAIYPIIVHCLLLFCDGRANCS